MKKVVLLFVIFFVLSAASAQKINASPFEGRWVWDGEGDYPEFIELVFFGDIMLIMEEFMPYYIGGSFAHAGGNISVEEFEIEWRYRLFGNTLIITNEDGDNVTFTRTQMQRSPLEGVWRVVEDAGEVPDEEMYIMFIGDIMAINEGDVYMGFSIEFKAGAFHPSMSLFEDELHFIPEEEIEAFFATLLLRYSISGNYLILTTHLGEELTARKIR